MANKIVTSSKLFRHGSIKWGRFPGGNPNILFENQEYLNNKDVVYCMSGKLSDVSEEESFLIALCRQGIKSLQIHMPYYGVATMERVGKKNIVATAETIAKMISTPLLSTKTGKPILIIHDMHALPVRFYFPDTVTVKPQTAIDILLEILKTTHPDIVIAFPDDGAYKRFAEYFEGFRMIVCAKARKGDERVVTIFKKENWPKDDSVCREHVIIIDDLTRSGGTIEECEKALKKEGFENVSAYVTHAAFDRPEDYQKFFTENGGKFHKFYTTDSIQDNAREIKGHAPFEVIELGTHSAREILKECDLPWHKLEEQKTINVYVASTNETKMGAVYDVISKANEGCIVNVYGVEDISSGVSEQPIGLETHQGSKNRLANLQEWVKYHGYEYDYLVSIENGIDLNIQSNSDTQATQAETPSDAQATQSDAQATQSEASSEPFDFCVISMRKAGSVYMNESTLRTYIGRVQHLIDQSVKLGKTVTVGSMIEKEFAYLKGAWHKHFGPHTRYDMITDTLLRTLGDVKSQ
ncbi:MAG: DUF84 family protein [Proteobacteria bacterium]|nr:DUF84 family protein [Pseudomonadota bacterium]